MLCDSLRSRYASDPSGSVDRCAHGSHSDLSNADRSSVCSPSFLCRVPPPASGGSMFGSPRAHTGLAVLLGLVGRSLLAQSTVPVATEFSNLHFRSIGPVTMSGRIADVAVYEADPAIFYVAAAHGGIWKTTSNGALFTPLLQDEGLMSMGAVAVSQKDPNLVWAGSGESNNRQSTSWGEGIYKSTNGGQTWSNMGLRTSKTIGRIVIDPTNNDIVFVAAGGSLYGPGGERGLYKTTDGGRTWKQVLKVDDMTGANDVVQSF